MRGRISVNYTKNSKKVDAGGVGDKLVLAIGLFEVCSKL